MAKNIYSAIVTLENGREIWADVNFRTYREHYGADADGNRGEWRTFFEVESIGLKAKDGQPLTDLEAEEAEELAEERTIKGLNL